MRQAFARALPDIQMVEAHAHNLKVFEDGTFHAVFVAQAFHWFDTEGECL